MRESRREECHPKFVTTKLTRRTYVFQDGSYVSQFYDYYSGVDEMELMHHPK
jgi:hypothetical protein